jgi:hypothetical protein
VVLGEGIALFDGVPRIDLRPTQVLADPGVTHVLYDVL